MPEFVSPTRTHGLVDILDRVLDKGLVIAGDIKINLANVELLTIQVRLLVCSIDKAEQIGLNWWRYDTNLTTRAAVAEAENVELRERVAALHGHLLSLGDTWRDQEHQKFTEEFEQTMVAITRFIEASNQHIPFLMRKAERIEEYLQQR